MENKEKKVVEPQVEETTKKKSLVKSVAKTVVILVAAGGLGIWLGKRGFRGMGDDIQAGFGKMTGTVKNMMPKKSEQVQAEVCEPKPDAPAANVVREPRNEYRGYGYRGNNNKNYNN